MRIFRIDFTQDNPLVDGCYIGRIGEHNATELIITPPAEMTEDEVVTSYIIVFATGVELIHSKPFVKAEKLSVPIWKQLTHHQVLGIQLEAYDDAGDFIGKSVYVSGLKLLASAHGKDVDADTDNPDFISEFLKNKHSHKNKEMLDKFGEDGDGNPLYDGQPIGSCTGSGLTEEQATAIEANTKARHTHSNQDVLDVLTPEVMEQFDDTVKDAHTHGNKTVLDKISESENGKLLFDGEEIASSEVSSDSINIVLKSKYFTNYDDCDIATSRYSDDGIDFEIYEELPQNAVVYDIGVRYNGVDYSSNEMVQNALIGNNAAVHIYGEPTFNEELGTTLIASIVNNLESDTLYYDIANYSGGVTGFTVYYMIAKGNTTESDSDVDLTGYATEEYVDKAIEAAQPDLTDYLKESDLDDAVNKALTEAKESGEFDGTDGYTPEKGTDYFTETDKAEIVDSVVAETGIDIIPDYVITEAESVIDRIIAAQSNRTFTFAAISDLHYGNGGYTDGIKHACQAMKYIDERIKLDAVAVLGDYTDGYPAEGFENAVGDFKTINSILAELRFAPNLRTQGNHDYYANHTALVNRFIQSYSDNVVWGNKSGGYFYRDFEEFKLRIICVNTTETGNANIGCSTEQYQWFINSLDLTAKEDVTDWQILVLSHHPLDWYTTDSTYRFAYYLDGYKNGASGTAGGIAYNFTDKNSATLIGNIHGHIHNLLTDYINIGNINTSNPTSVIRMCTPEACINRANQYEAWAEDTAYEKIINTAEDTSFVVYCIDLDTNVITAVCYGAGYDRKVNYVGGAINYNVTYNLTNIVSSNTSTFASENTPYNSYLSATVGKIVSVAVTMGGVDITNTVYSNGVIAIPAVTGDIIITASAKEDEPETTYTNQIPVSVDTDGSVYNSVGYKNGYRLNSSGTETAETGSSVTGFIPVTQEDIIRIKNIALTVDVDSTNQYIRVYDSEFTHIGGCKTNKMTENAWLFADVTTDSTTGYITSFRLTNGLGDTPAYLRISASTFDSNAVITVNEPIE